MEQALTQTHRHGGKHGTEDTKVNFLGWRQISKGPSRLQKNA